MNGNIAILDSTDSSVVTVNNVLSETLFDK